MISSGPWFSGERGFQASVVFRRASLSCGFVIVSRSRKRRLVVPAMAFGGDGIRWRWHSVAMALEIAVEIAGGWVLRGFVSIV